jgi:hypothetical protein
MKTYIKYIFTSLILPAAFSCSNDFLDNNNSDNYISAPNGEQYALYVLPERDAAELPIYCRGAVNAKFTLSSIPHWLNILSTSGQFTDETAYINCSASVNSEFSDIGIYIASMTIDVEGLGKYVIPVYYINEGKPVLIANNGVDIIDMDYYYGQQLINVYNADEGILVWEIVKYPKWINLELLEAKNILFPHEATSFAVSYNELYTPEMIMEGMLNGKIDYPGQIVFASNSMKQEKRVIEVTFGQGTPILHYYIENNAEFIDFGQEQTKQSLTLINQGDGILTWFVEDCPEWITFSQTQGVLYYGNHTVSLTLTCDRSKASAGENSARIKIKSNDPYNSEYEIEIKCSK